MADAESRLRDLLHDRYRIERKLGEGGMATVYLAHDVRHDREVAVKVLKPELAQALGGDRFLREVRIAAKLSHPHILPLHDSGEAEGFLYYVMPYVKGESLRERLAREGELPVADAVRILKEVADALAHAHGEGVVHRDIKPDNVMLSGRHALVTDFGVAKAVSEATGRNQITTAGIALGTPTYMAPEQASADPNVDHRADIYSLGAMAYELLAGKPPFSGASAQAVLAAHVTETPDPVTKSRPAVPASLAEAVMHCLEKKPADRFQSADDVLHIFESMDSASGGHAPTMATSGFTGGAKNTARRGIMAGVVIVVLAAAVFFGSKLGGPATVEAADRKSIAVLPFSNTSGDEENEGFVNGLHDDLLTHISKIGELRVTSRTSVMQYRGTTKNLREIGEELGVATLLEGGVQRAGNRVRINAQLIDARTDEHLWAENYNRELTAANIFAIQSEIAEAIAAALQAQLSPAERADLSSAPTDNLEAYEHYLRGLHHGYFAIDSTAYTAFERAAAIDPEFAEAWAAASRARSWQHRVTLGTQTEPEVHARHALNALEKAVALDSSSVETKLAQGYAEYYLNWDFVAALEYFEPLSARYPNNADLHFAVGLQYRRQGRWPEALSRMRTAARLAPRDMEIRKEFANTFEYMGQYDSALVIRQQIVDLGGGTALGELDYINLLLSAFGDTAGARRVLAGMERSDITGRLLASSAASLYLDMTGDVAILDQNFFEVPQVPNMLSATGRLYRARVTRDSAGMKRLADSLLATLDPPSSDPATRVERKVAAEKLSTIATYHSVLGQREPALDAIERALAYAPLEFDAADYPSLLQNALTVYLDLGLYSRALDALEEGRSLNALWAARGALRLSRYYDPLRDEPRFQALLGS